jgi:hypothetical protein
MGSSFHEVGVHPTLTLGANASRGSCWIPGSDTPCTGVKPLHSNGLFHRRSYWIPGSSAPALSEKHNSFLRLLKNKGFKEAQ